MSIKTEAVVKINNVSYRYNQELVLDSITLDIHKGEFLGVIGPNGSGKTTLLKIILGIFKPTKGNVYLFGTQIQKFKDWDKVGYVPQKPGTQVLQFPVTVEEIVQMGLIGKTGSVDQALGAVGMFGQKKSLMRELSGGQQQRVFIARSLVSQPELLILDEPTAGVDVDAQADFYELLRRLNKQMNLTLILVSHDIDVIANEVTTLACLNGKLICHLPPKQFIKEDYLSQVYGKDMHMVVHGH